MTAQTSRRSRWLVCLAALSLTGFALSASAQTSTPTPAVVANQSGPMEQHVLSQIHATNQLEMDAGKLAMSKGTTDGVRRYGARLLRDHRFADEKVTQLAQTLHIDLVKPQPKTPEQEQHAQDVQNLKQELQTDQGAQFDHAFLQGNVKGHEYAISHLEEAETKLPKGAVRTLVQKLVPILRQHLALAQDLSTKGVTQ